MPQFYSGRFYPTRPEKYVGNVGGIVYRSSWELATFKWLDRNPTVAQWASEEVVVPYLCEVDGQQHRYFPDLMVKFRCGKRLLIEIKPAAQTRVPKRRSKAYVKEALQYIQNQNKWAAADAFAAANGMEFVVWDESVLRARGILRVLKALPPLKKEGEEAQWPDGGIARSLSACRRNWRPTRSSDAQRRPGTGFAAP